MVSDTVTGMVEQRSISEAEARAIVETAVDGIISIDVDGQITSFNPAAMRIFGYAPEEIIGRNIDVLMPEPHKTHHDRYVKRYLDGGTPRIIGIGRELEATTKSGLAIPIYLAVSEFEVDGERRFTGIIHDLTRQRESEAEVREHRERLAHAGRLGVMGEMTAGIAHEINQPLTAISMYAGASINMLDSGNFDVERVKAALEKLNTQSLRAGAVIERIQRFVRDQESQKDIVDLNELVADLVGLAQTDARLHDIDIELSLAENVPALRCDPVQIQQVGLNLIRNAIDAMTEIDCANGRIIRVRTEWTGQRVKVEVEDSGIGIDPDEADRLFTLFHTTKANGMGMGLSICRSIVNNHGGMLAFRRNSGPGVTFYFTLPIEDEDG